MKFKNKPLRLGFFDYANIDPTSSSAKKFAEEITGIIENILIHVIDVHNAVVTQITIEEKDYNFHGACIPATIGQNVILHLEYKQANNQVNGVQLLNKNNEVTSRFTSDRGSFDRPHFVE